MYAPGSKQPNEEPDKGWVILLGRWFLSRFSCAPFGTRALCNVRGRRRRRPKLRCSSAPILAP